jgi:glycine dehydrogenase
VRRIDQAYGDRNLVCSCPPPEAFAEHDFEHATMAAQNGTDPGRPAGAPDDLGTTADVVGAQA